MSKKVFTRSAQRDYNECLHSPIKDCVASESFLLTNIIKLFMVVIYDCFPGKLLQNCLIFVGKATA